MNLGEYEQEQIRAINEWRLEKPTVINTALSYVMFPISIFIQALVSESAIRSAIDGTSAAAEWLVDVTGDDSKGLYSSGPDCHVRHRGQQGGNTATGHQRCHHAGRYRKRVKSEEGGR